MLDQSYSDLAYSSSGPGSMPCGRKFCLSTDLKKYYTSQKSAFNNLFCLLPIFYFYFRFFISFFILCNINKTSVDLKCIFSYLKKMPKNNFSLIDRILVLFFFLVLPIKLIINNLKLYFLALFSCC